MRRRRRRRRRKKKKMEMAALIRVGRAAPLA
jgi:hypothetical protein